MHHSLEQNLFTIYAYDSIALDLLIFAWKDTLCYTYILINSKLDNIKYQSLRSALIFYYLLTVCITQGIFPRMLKCAEVSPIYKKGNNMDVGNYRPVSILPIMSKVFEKVIINQISSYFDSIFHPCIFGFRKGYSCESIKCSLDKGNIVCCILMDLSRAFHCIPHKLLISKFKAYGVSVSACDVITSYLKDRRQRVKIGTQRSEWMHAHKGSAQGLCLVHLVITSSLMICLT